MDEPIFYNLAPDFNEIPTIYASGEIPIIENQKMVRLETKRGCPYKCTFCAHRNVLKSKVEKHSKNKIFEELAFLKEKKVKRINILDPIFNAGNEYLDIMQEINRLNMNAEITLQTRFEFIHSKEGEIFLDLAEKIGAQLEFGLQTINENEQKVIKRGNQKDKISNVLTELNKRGIHYEVSLIYGLPTQTLESFKKSIDFVQNNKCENIVAYPLMLLKGTEIYEDKEKYGFKEEILGDFNIPTVTSSNSFTKSDWLKMKKIAHSLEKKYRY